MYKYANKQIKFEDFGQPVGLHMSPENRWIKRAESIPFDSSLMVYFGKRLTPDILGEINELIIQKAQEKNEADCHDDNQNHNDKPEPPQNSGTLIVDATAQSSKQKSADTFQMY